MPDDLKAKASAATLPPNLRREAAGDYRRRGWKPVPIPKGKKHPVTTNWPWLGFPDSAFPRIGGGGIGVQFGKPSGGLCDVDLDCDEARELAPHFLPETAAIFGRKSTPRAHWLYVCDAWKTSGRRAATPYDDPEPPPGTEHGARMLEWRTGSINKKTGKVKGAMSMFPPSKHSSGERVRWDKDGEPATVKASELEESLGRLAVAVLLARHWPHAGKRQEAALIVGGMLARASLSADAIEVLVGRAAQVAGDEEWEGRGKSAAGAVARLASGEDTAGFPRMAEMWGEKIARRAHDFLLRAGYAYQESKGASDSAAVDASPGSRRAIVLPAGAPVAWAAAFMDAQYARDGVQGLVHYRDGFYEWTGTHFEQCNDAYLRSLVYRFLNAATVKKKQELVPFNPDQSKVNRTIDALKAIAEEHGKREAPFWLDGRAAPDPANLIACRNGLLDFTTRELHEHSPQYFNLNALPFDYDPAAPPPKLWNRFLRELWPDTDEVYRDKDGNEKHRNDGLRARGTLQEIFGLTLTTITSQQKLFMIIGPPRSGKGTIGRVQTALLGPDNVASPTLSDLSGNFGMAVLIGKRLALMSDARIGGGRNVVVVVERLLSISGEDRLGVGRKYKEDWTGRLQCRVVILTNELPHVPENSGAFAARFVLLVLTESWLGKEDPELTDKLCHELPGILNWSLAGLDRLRRRGRFRMPKSSRQVMRQLQDLTSPISAFIRDWCEKGSDKKVAIEELFRAWCLLCEREQQRAGSKIMFQRNLHAALPHVVTRQRRRRGVRERYYLGVGLSEAGQDLFDRLGRASPSRRTE
jgi:putative DNA primase/helicase